MERAYLTRKAMGLDDFRFNGIEDEERAELIAKELWVEGHYEKYLKEQQTEQAEAYKDNARYKRYKRFMKKNK